MAKVAALILAAGRATRFGASDEDSKVLATIDNEPMVRRVVRTTLASGAHPVIVVTGHAAAAVGNAVHDLPIENVYNADFRSGMAGSLKLGLAALPDAIEGALIVLADMPLVGTAALAALIRAFGAASPTTDAVVPLYRRQPGNPILLARRMFDAVMGLHGDVGARSLLAEPGRNLVFCEVDDPGVAIDIDTLVALQTVRAGR